MDFLIGHAADIFGILTATVTLASLIANLTKTDADNKLVATLSKAVNFLALNFKK